MKSKILSILLAFLIVSESAFAGCWMECLGVKVNGQCIGAKTKMCNWSGYEEDVARVGSDIQGFENHLSDEWRNLYAKALPENVRKAINSTSIFLASAYFLGVDPTLIGGVLGVVVTRSVLRGEQAKTIHTPEKPWIKQLDEQGNSEMTQTEAQIALSHQDAKVIFQTALDERGVWLTYVSCLAGSTTQQEAFRSCYMPFSKSLFEVKNAVLEQVLNSER